MTDTTPATRELAAQGIPYRMFQHAGPVDSLEQAARERDEQPEQVIRSIVFHVGQGEFVMVLMAGTGQVNWRSLRKHLGQSRLTMATAVELMQSTGYVAGAVSPFGLPAPLRVLIDEGVVANDEVSLGSGVRGLAIIMRVDDLRRALPLAEVGRFGPSTDATRGRSSGGTD